jgi:hypothetical protein
VSTTSGGGTSAKGLQAGALGLFASVILGVASVAPAYSMAATAGLLAIAAGAQGPMAMILGFIPMLLVSAGFYYMNRADPDCGETFIWTARAFGPATGVGDRDGEPRLGRFVLRLPVVRRR